MSGTYNTWRFTITRSCATIYGLYYDYIRKTVDRIDANKLKPSKHVRTATHAVLAFWVRAELAVNLSLRGLRCCTL